MTEEDVQLIQNLEEWEMNDIEGQHTHYDLLPGGDEFA